MPRPRYTVRSHANRRYSVWDNETDTIAIAPNGNRSYSDLSVDDAFRVADQLNLDLAS